MPSCRTLASGTETAHIHLSKGARITKQGYTRQQIADLLAPRSEGLWSWTQIFAQLVDQGVTNTSCAKFLAHGEWGTEPSGQLVLNDEGRAKIREWLGSFYPPTEAIE